MPITADSGKSLTRTNVVAPTIGFVSVAGAGTAKTVSASAMTTGSLRRPHRICQEAGDRHRPDPAGHGSHRTGMRHFVEGDIADQPRPPVRLLDARDTDVDHNRARLDPVAFHQLRGTG